MLQKMESLFIPKNKNKNETQFVVNMCVCVCVQNSHLLIRLCYSLLCFDDIFLLIKSAADVIFVVFVFLVTLLNICNSNNIYL